MADTLEDGSGYVYGDLLLESKTTRPTPGQVGVSRAPLVEAARRSGARVVSVVAPAGYGKTTLLAEWADRDERQVAWASLERYDDDPAALLTLLATAVARIFPELRSLVGEMRGLGPASLGRSAPLLGGALAVAPSPFVLMVDDVHEADSPGCRDVLEVVASGVPDGSQLVLASRHEPTNLARRRAAGELFEIGSDDLRVEGDGARRIFLDASAEISDEDLDTVVRRCEGWPTGIFLAATIARTDPGAAAITGDDRFLADYLYEECLRALPDDLRRFLRCTAILDQLSGPACDGLLDSSDASDRLREVEARGLFLIPMDRRRGVYRYHALFREFLLAELERSDAAMIPDLHRRAADWAEQHGSPELAIEHLLLAGERDRSVHLVTRVALPAYQRGRVAVLGRWLGELGDEAIAGYPPLAVLAAWQALLTGDSVAAERWASVVEHLSHDGEPTDDQPTFASARAMLRAAMCADGADSALAEAEFAEASEPTWSFWRDQALHLLGSTRLLVGDVEGARAAFVEGGRLAQDLGNSDSVVLCESELAALDIDANRWDEAQPHVGVALRAIEANHMEGYLTTALALATAARSAAHRGDVVSARRLLARAMRVRVQCTHTMPYLAIKARLQLARAHLPLGERASAMHLVHEMDEILAKRPDLGLLGAEVAAFRDQVAQAQTVNGNTPLTPAELRLLPYLQTHLTIGEIAERLFVSRNTASSEVSSIYRKLDVTTRSEAVDRSVTLGLLGA